MSFTLVQIAVGGAAGAVSRYLTGQAAMRVMGPGFPWGTLTVNVVGSFVMGVIVVTLAELSANRISPLLVTGFLGAFTTFSSFSLDTAYMWERGETVQAGAYVAASVVLSLAALFAGLWAARGVIA
ncbi:fluoride efflux transporter CrcB [Roseivivax marinus]|uniref:fluoride efflux transporter CrcB n=1 Tax=Roseivivax marinus TaxID=1379903 RepID=UPI001F043ACB|nr:fluoride efflux transporter CrcB [Roseivivax marinus]UMA64279.1 fluoride efflux transporter CrcB [Roseivivax marinus]